MIKAFIVDDDINVRQNVFKTLSQMHEIEIVGQAGDVLEGIEMMKENKPDLVLLDVELPSGTGFDILDRFDPEEYKLIVITGYNQYAIQAIKHAALDYILKPVDEKELKRAVQSALEKLEHNRVNEQMISEYRSKGKEQDRLIIPSDGDKRFLLFKDILYLKSDGGYTLFYTSDNSHVITSKSINYFESHLPKNRFHRIHKSYMVNYDFVKLIPAGRSGMLKMPNEKEVYISVRKMASFRKWVKENAEGVK